LPSTKARPNAEPCEDPTSVSDSGALTSSVKIFDPSETTATAVPVAARDAPTDRRAPSKPSTKTVSVQTMPVRAAAGMPSAAARAIANACPRTGCAR